MRKAKRIVGLGARQAWLWRHRYSFSSGGRDRLPRILVDVSEIIRHDAQTGIQRVVRAIWTELSKRSGTNFTVHPIYATSRRGYCYAPVSFLEHRAIRVEGEPVGMGSGDHFLGLDLSAHLLPKFCQQLRAWRANGAKAHLVVYDLLPLLSPEWFSRPARNHFRRWFQLLCFDTDQAICISDQVARDLASQLPRDSLLQINRLLMGSDIASSRPSVGLSKDVCGVLERARTRPAILMVGTIEPRKGYEVALAAFEHLWHCDPANSPDLVIVGKRGWKTSALQDQLMSHPELGKRLFWLEGVSDEGLCKLYDAARCALIASRGEGFGLPLIEAAAHRCHVLARDLPVFREQRLQNVSFFSDDCPAALGGRIMNLLEMSAERLVVVPNLPTWSESADHLLAEIGIATPEDYQFPMSMRQAS